MQNKNVDPNQLVARLKEQKANPLYGSSEARFNYNKELQLIKAAEKYPEPLNPNSWTGEELANHAFQEHIDAMNYVEAMNYKITFLELFRNQIIKDVESRCSDEDRVEMITATLVGYGFLKGGEES